MNTKGESESPSGNCSRYSSCPRQSTTSTQPRRAPVGSRDGKLIRSTKKKLQAKPVNSTVFLHNSFSSNENNQPGRVLDLSFAENIYLHSNSA